MIHMLFMCFLYYKLMKCEKDIEWKRYIEKAERRIKTSQYLFNKENDISFAAFNAQQCVELSVKAVASLYGFDDFLKQHSKKTYPFRTHNPSQIFIDTLYLLLDECFPDQDKLKQKFSKIFCNNDAIEIVNEARLSISDIQKYFNQISKQSDPGFQEMWLRSLGLSRKGFPITSYDMYNQFHDERLNNIDSMCLVTTRDLMLEFKKYCKKNRAMDKFHYFKKEIVQIFIDIGLPEKMSNNFVTVLIADGDSAKAIENCKQISNEFVNKVGLVEIMDLLFAPNKIFSKYETEPSISHLVIAAKKRIDFLWVAYLLILSPTVVLLYPHEIFGKYPTYIKLLQKNSEDIYKERKEQVNLLIREAKHVFERIKIFCNTGYKLSIFD